MYSELVICKDNYNSQEEFENTIKQAIKLLLKANYICTVRYDEKEFGIVVIEFNPSDPALGYPRPCWTN